MKKYLCLFLVFLLCSSFTLLRMDGKVGAIGDCTVDADVDTAGSTTVDADSNSGQPVLNVAATTSFTTGDTLIINPLGARAEDCTIQSISAGVSVTCTTNLVFNHTGAQADVVRLTNRIGPLSGGYSYVVQLVTSANAVQAGRFAVGNYLVDGGETTLPGVTLTALTDTGAIVTLNSDQNYISFVTQTANAIGRACQIR